MPNAIPSMPNYVFPNPQVLHHPGTFEQYAPLMQRAAQAALRDWASAAAAGAHGGGAGAHPLVQTAVVRGCAQLLVWATQPGGASGHGPPLSPAELLAAVGRSLPGGGHGVQMMSLGQGADFTAAADAAGVQPQAQGVSLLSVRPAVLPLLCCDGAGEAEVEATVAVAGQGPAGKDRSVRALVLRAGQVWAEQTFELQHSPAVPAEPGRGSGTAPPEALPVVARLRLRVPLPAEPCALQLVLTPPPHADGSEDGGAEAGAAEAGAAAGPSVLGAAALVALPAAAAAELAGLRATMLGDLRQEGDEGHEEGHAGVEAACWRDHLGPLVCDLAAVVEACGSGGAGCPPWALGVASELHAFLERVGCGATAALVRAAVRPAAAGPGSSPFSLAAPQAGGVAAEATGATARPASANAPIINRSSTDTGASSRPLQEGSLLLGPGGTSCCEADPGAGPSSVAEVAPAPPP
jgi:hypothetical protein